MKPYQLLFILFQILLQKGIIGRLSILNSFQRPISKRGEILEVTTNKVKLKWLPNGVKDGIASGLAAVVAKSILQPFDTVKTLQQARSIKMGPVRAGLAAIKDKGFLSLWRGLGVTVMGSAPSVAVYFGSYSTIKASLTKNFPNNSKIFNIIVSAAVGNTIASTLRAPYEVIKQRIQTGMYSSTRVAVSSIWKAEKLGGFFMKGKLASQIIRDVPYAVITLLSYETLQSIVKQRALNAANAANHNGTTTIITTTPTTTASWSRLNDIACGSLAGGVSSFLTNPMDVVKTRMMTTSRYASIPDAVGKIASEEGLNAFFSGCTLRLLHKIPANGLFFLCYETFRDMLGVERPVVVTVTTKNTN
eukprot:gene12384-26051_t